MLFCHNRRKFKDKQKSRTIRGKKRGGTFFLHLKRFKELLERKEEDRRRVASLKASRRTAQNQQRRQGEDDARPGVTVEE